MSDEQKDNETKQLQAAVDIFYDRSPLYRTVSPSGALAGITPNAAIQVLFYTDLAPVPEYVRQELVDQRKLGQELDKIQKQGIHREYDVGVVLNKVLTKSLIELLAAMLKQLEKVEIKDVQVEESESGS